MNVGDKVKNTVDLNFNCGIIIPAGTIGVVKVADDCPHNLGGTWYGYEIAFEGFWADTFPCALKEIEVVE